MLFSNGQLWVWLWLAVTVNSFTLDNGNMKRLTEGRQEQNSYRCDITCSTQLNSLYSLSSLSWHILTHDTWYLKTLFKPSLFKSSCFKHLNIPWLMKHGLNPLYHRIKRTMINETFEPSLLPKRFHLGTGWDLHDLLGTYLPSLPLLGLPKVFL